MYKSINELLCERKNEAERREELFSLLPELKDNELIYYNNKNYIYMVDDIIYHGSDLYSSDTEVRGAFFLLFIISSIYEARKMLEEIKNSEILSNDSKYYENAYKLATLKGYGVLGNYKKNKEILDSIKSE